MNNKHVEDNKKEEMVQCPLCGYKFLESESTAACASCPLNKKSCGNVKCPNCGYDFPVPHETKIEKFFKKHFGRSK